MQSAPTTVSAATLQGIIADLDDNAKVRNVGAPYVFEVVVGPPSFDDWCPVTVSAGVPGEDDNSIQYLWLKDASTQKTRRIYGAKRVAPGSTAALLTQNLKRGYRAKPLLYSSERGLFEGEAFTVK